MTQATLVLASHSPRRKELLELLGIPFTVVPARIDEVPKPGELPTEFVTRAAGAKCAEVSGRVSGSVVLAADTIVTIDGEVLGKPADEREAVRMLKKLSGCQHSVYTAVCIINQNSGTTLEGLERTDVWFKTLDEETIRDYIRREHVLDKAGAYAIQGFAAAFIPKIEGNYPNVVGLPLPLTYELLCRTLS